MVLRTVTIPVLLALCACGDNLKPPKAQMPELVADPSVAVGCTQAPPPSGEVRAKRVECVQELVSGPLAAGRVGDFVLENRLVRFVVRGPGEGFRLHGTAGGGLVDAALHNREDQLLELQPMLDWGVGAFEELVIVSSGASGVAELVVRGPVVALPALEARGTGAPPQVVLEQRYRLRPDTPHLEILTSAYTAAGQTSLTRELKDLAFLGAALRPFVPETGFVTGAGANGRFLASEGGETSYGLVYPDRVDEPLFVVELYGLFLLRATELRSDEPAIARHFIVGDGSVSSVTDIAHGLAVEHAASSIAGQGPPGWTLGVTDQEGRALSRVLVDPEGEFSLLLPPGIYGLRSVEEGTVPGPMVEVALGSSPLSDIEIERGASGDLLITATDDAGSPLPVRVTVESATSSRQLHIGASGEARMRLPPGDYTVSVSRGVEYSLFRQLDVSVTEGAAQTVDVVLERELDTEGWIAVDTHLHSEMSTDSSIPLAERLAAVAAEGIEVAISTDHDFLTDYNPYVEALGLAGHLVTQVGSEASSTVIGHINGWPLVADPASAGAGAVPWYGQAPGQVANLLRNEQSERVIQVNHPRRNASSTFSAIDLDPVTLSALADPETLGMPGADLNDFVFDLIEVANAKSIPSFDLVFADWLAFASQGRFKTATGASDSHHANEFVGRARTYVWVGPQLDNATSVDLSDLNQALKDGRATVSQGAFVTMSIEDPISEENFGIGEVAPLQGQPTVALRVVVQAAGWLPLSKLLIYERGALVLEMDLDSAASQPLRLDQVFALPLTLDDDTFFVARVEAVSDETTVLPEPGPSFTNPIFVDRDGDGLYAP